MDDKNIFIEIKQVLKEMDGALGKITHSLEELEDSMALFHNMLDKNIDIDDLVAHLSAASYWISQVAEKIKDPEELSPDENEEYDVYEPHVANMLRAIDFAAMYFLSLKELREEK